MNKKFCFAFLLLFYTTLAFTQIGGRRSFEFLRLPASSRITALGGNMIATADDDVNLALANPSSLNEKTSGTIAFNYNFHFAGIGQGHIAYGFGLKKLGLNNHIAATFINYGEFISADDLGQQNGNFTASESAITLGSSKQINERITIGSNIKFAISAFEQYRSNGLLLDLGGMYSTNENRTKLAAVFQNFGTELTTLNGKRYGAPFDFQVGFSNRLKYMPFRFSVILHRLYQWGIRYDDPNFTEETNLGGNEEGTSAFKAGVDNFFRHVVINGEFLLGKNENLRLRAGYNHLRRAELSLSQFRSSAGFSLGFGLKINKFRIDYGVGYHHLAGGTNHLSISTNLNSFKSKLE
jgi:hypothetical protein